MNDTMTYETAFARLSTILEEMGKPQASLEQSLKLYEEADQLIAFCHTRLSQAEQRIEVLIKNRSAQLALDEQGRPLTEDLA